MSETSPQVGHVFSHINKNPLISSIARINPFNGCSHYLKASQMIYDTDRLTGFSVMGSSIERTFWAICKIFFLNRILLLLPALRLAMIFLICMVYLVFFTLYFFSTLVCTKRFGKGFAYLPVLTSDRRLFMLFLGLCSCFWPFFCWLESNLFLKMPVNLIQYRRTVGVFNSQHFVFDLKQKSQS